MKYIFTILIILISKGFLNAQCTTAISSPTTSICKGASVVLTATGATTYSWNTGATTATISVSPTVTTSYTVTGIIAGTCTRVATTTITVLSLPNVSISPSSPTVCSGTAITLTASGASTYTWNTGITTSTINITPTISTTYTVTGKSGSGCTNTSVKTVTVNNPIALSVSSSTICAGVTTTLTASGSTTYSWNTGATTSTLAVTPTVNTTYSVTGTAGGCVRTLTTAITVNALPNVIISNPSPTICSGLAVILTASNATTYTWNTSATTSTISVTPTVTTNYTVTGTLNGCSKTATTSITVNALPTLTISPASPTICSGNSATLSVSGSASSYSWNTSETTTSVVVNPTITTSYSVTATSTAGCANTAVKTITVTNPLALALSSPSICAGGSFTITASGSSTYSWNTGATTSTIVVTPSVITTYTVQGTTGSCVRTLTISVNVVPLPNVVLSNPTPSICNGSSAILTVTGSATTYTWSNSATTASISVTPTTSTNYSVTGSFNGCSKTVTTSVAVLPLPTLTISPSSPTVCSGTAITLTVSGSASSYTWGTGETTTTISISPTITTAYTAIGTLTNGCTNSAVKSVTVSNPVAISVASQTICTGSSTTLTASGSSTYSWSTGATTSTIAVSPTVATTYTLKGTTGGCVRTISLTIYVSANPTVTISNPTPSVCLGSAAVLTATGASSYVWNTAAITPSISVTPTVTTIYTVTGTTAGCSKTATTSITIGCPFNYNGIGYKAKWTNLYGSISRNDTVKSDGTTVPAGYPMAISKNTLLASTNGWAEQVIGSPICSNYAVGFCDSATAVVGDYFDIDFAIHVYVTSLYVFYNGNVSYLGTVATNDVIRIERTGSTYYLKKNGTTLYTAAAPSKPLKLKGVLNVDPIVKIGCSFADTTGINFPNFVQTNVVSANCTGTGISDGSLELSSKSGAPGYTYTWTASSATTALLSGQTAGNYSVTVKDALLNSSAYSYGIDYKVNWTKMEGCNYSNERLSSDGPATGTGWSDAVGDNVLPNGAVGDISWRVDDLTSTKIAGLLDLNTSPAGEYSDIDDGLLLISNALYKKNQGTYTFISYVIVGDVLKIQKNGSTINYYKNNVLISTATTLNTAVDVKIKAAIYIDSPSMLIKTSFPSSAVPPPNIPDAQLNWHQEEVFDENGNVVSTEKTYLDNLGRGTQELIKNATNEVFTSQTIYDSYGRPAINTMPAFTGNALIYQSWLMRTPSGQEYNYAHFDTPTTLNNPNAIATTLNGSVGYYYSNNNAYDLYQATADNPYTRVEYTGDPGASIRRESKPGNAFKMGSGKENYSFTMISGDELRYYYGANNSYKAMVGNNKTDCSHLTINDNIVATKIISLSPDNVETVKYMVGNKLIMSCFSGLSAGQVCSAVLSTVSNKLSYKGTKSTDIHLASSKKTTLSIPTFKGYNSGNTNFPFTFSDSYITIKITDLYTDKELIPGTDYTFNTGTRSVQFSAALLNLYLNRSMFLRISYTLDESYEAIVLQGGHTFADPIVNYEIDYARNSRNFYDLAGALRKSVSPKGTDCPNFYNMSNYTTYDYDHHGQVISKSSPDEGLVEMTYDKEGRIRFTQNALQKTNNQFSYVNYDKHGRAVESGEYQSTNASGSAWFTNYYLQGPPTSSVGITTQSIIDQQDGLLNAQKTNTTITGYTVPSGANVIPSGYTYISQYQNFRNGQVNFVKNKNSTIWYNYDKVGRPKATITQITEADYVSKKPSVDDQIKTSESVYNYFNGITSSATYQNNNSAEKLYYQYGYDANYRPTTTNLTFGSTSQNLTSNVYNKKGQLKRTVLGNNYQGLDFVYTLNGGLKAINHPGLDNTLDPGADNGDYSGAIPANVNKDLFGEIVEFYNNDYQRNNTNINSSISVGNSKYDGLIYAVRYKTRAQVNSTNTGADYVDYLGSSQSQLITGTNYQQQELAFTYAYDEFNQLAKSIFNTYNNSTNLYTTRTEYSETGAAGGNISYDKNGNLTRLVRTSYGGVTLDDLTNTIDAASNKLTAIVDAASNSFPQSFNFKTPSQSSTSPFVYNSVGQLTQSSAENINNITYMPDGKVKVITFTNGNTTTYEYGADGQKIKSKFYNAATVKTKYTWYAGPYIYEFDEANANTFNIAEVNEGPAVIRVNGTSVTTGYLVYKVTDHLGNVRASFKSNGTGNGITILSYNDYYAFGGTLPGRAWYSENYRYGYQGQEKGDAGNPWYQFELRMYNQDIGRWFAPDPYGQFASPYIGMANNPVSAIDPDGGWVSMGGNVGSNTNSREWRKANFVGEFSLGEIQKRYDKAYKEIIDRFLNGDVIGQNKRDLDEMYEEIIGLINDYNGLIGNSGYALAFQNGVEYLTSNEAWLLRENGRLDNLYNAAGRKTGNELGYLVEDYGAVIGDGGYMRGSDGYAAQDRERNEITGKAQQNREALNALSLALEEGSKIIDAGSQADKAIEFENENPNAFGDDTNLIGLMGETSGIVDQTFEAGIFMINYSEAVKGAIKRGDISFSASEISSSPISINATGVTIKLDNVPYSFDKVIANLDPSDKVFTGWHLDHNPEFQGDYAGYKPTVLTNAGNNKTGAISFGSNYNSKGGVQVMASLRAFRGHFINTSRQYGYNYAYRFKDYPTLFKK